MVYPSGEMKVNTVTPPQTAASFRQSDIRNTTMAMLFLSPNCAVSPMGTATGQLYTKS